jgi:hypothetical protein
VLSDNDNLKTSEQLAHVEPSKDVPKGENDEDEDLEMPLSPIGDLGLSEPETAIVEDILKGDVSEMMPGYKAEDSQEEDNVINKSTLDDDDDDGQSVKDDEQEAKSSSGI